MNPSFSLNNKSIRLYKFNQICIQEEITNKMNNNIKFQDSANLTLS